MLIFSVKNKKISNAKDWPKEYSCNFLEAGVVSYTDVGQGVAYLRKETIQAMCPSFIGKPVLIDHYDVTPKTFERKAVGYVTKTWFNEQDGWFWCTFIVTDDKAKELIAKGYSVSCAFDVKATAAGGEWHNIKYDEELTDCSFTHLALVSSPRYEECKIYMNSKGMGTMRNSGNYAIIQDGIYFFVELLDENGGCIMKSQPCNTRDEAQKVVCILLGNRTHSEKKKNDVHIYITDSSKDEARIEKGGKGQYASRIVEDGNFFFVELLDSNGRVITRSEACTTHREAMQKRAIMQDNRTHSKGFSTGECVSVMKSGNQVTGVVLEVAGEFIKVQPRGGAHHFWVHAEEAKAVKVFKEENSTDEFQILERDRYMNNTKRRITCSE